MTFIYSMRALRTRQHRARRAMRRCSSLRTRVRCVVARGGRPLAWRADHGTDGCVQLPCLGLTIKKRAARALPSSARAFFTKKSGGDGAGAGAADIARRRPADGAGAWAALAPPRRGWRGCWRTCSTPTNARRKKAGRSPQKLESPAIYSIAARARWPGAGSIISSYLAAPGPAWPATGPAAPAGCRWALARACRGHQGCPGLPCSSNQRSAQSLAPAPCHTPRH